jgi:hypothetical protein
VNTVMNLRVLRIIFWLVENPWDTHGNFCCIKLAIYWSTIILGNLIAVQLIEELHAINWIRQIYLIVTPLDVYFFRQQTATQSFIFISWRKLLWVVTIGSTTLKLIKYQNHRTIREELCTSIKNSFLKAFFAVLQILARFNCCVYLKNK